MRVLACEPLPNTKFVRQHEVQLTDLDELLAHADVVSLHAPLSAATRGLIGEAQLSRMKRGAVLVNTSRGEIVDEGALLAALSRGAIAAAALDVFAEEPYAGPLAKLDNAVLTAHMGSATSETRIQMELEATENLITALTGVRGDR